MSSEGRSPAWSKSGPEEEDLLLGLRGKKRSSLTYGCVTDSACTNTAGIPDFISSFFTGILWGYKFQILRKSSVELIFKTYNVIQPFPIFCRVGRTKIVFLPALKLC